MKIKKVVSLMIITSVILAIMLSGCGVTPSGSDPTKSPDGSGDMTETDEKPDGSGDMTETDEKVEIIYYSWSDEDDYMPDLIEAFEKTQSEITVKYQSFPSAGEEYYQKILTMLASEVPIDVFGVNSTQFYYTFLSRNTLLLLDDYLKEAGIDMYEWYGTLASQTEVGDGHYYAMIHRKTAWPLYYNKDIFDEMNVSYPTEPMTWDEFLELAIKMTKVRDDGTIQYGCLFAFPTGNSGFLYASQMGERLDMPEVKYFREALEFYTKVYESGATMPFNEILSLATGANQRAVFQNGDAAMYPAGDWNVSTFLREESEGKLSINWDVTYMPIPNGAKEKATIGCATNTGIASYSTKKDAAFKFLSYMCGEEGASVLASKGILPAYNSSKISEIYKKVAPDKNLGVLFELNVMEELPKGTSSNDLVKMNQAAIELYLLGEVSLDDTLKKWEEERQRLIAAQEQVQGN